MTPSSSVCPSPPSANPPARNRRKSGQYSPRSSEGLQLLFQMRGRWHGEAVTDKVDSSRLRNAVHLISRLSATASPHRGSLLDTFCRGGANNEIQCKKVQTGKSGLHLLLMATILRQLAANLIPPYQAARSQTPVR